MKLFLRAQPYAYTLHNYPKYFCAQEVAKMSIGVPKEVYTNEKRVALTPEGVERLRKSGFGKILVEKGAGIGSSIPDEHYRKAGAEIVDSNAVFSTSDIILKVR